LIGLMASGKINGKLAKDIFPKMAGGEAPEVIMQREGLESISDEGALGKIIDEVIAANPKQVEQYKGGKQQVIGFLVGQVMKASRGTANPALVEAVLRERLR
jgi:aspartyl-tRNA(Asn)/glutamyl-tRNA(Gln) amidotransferase subunit B